MMNKELRKLSRLELLELLVAQSRQTEELQMELAKAEDKLHKREMKIERAGSIAEAVISLSDVLEAAETAGRMYVNELEKLYEREKLVCAAMMNKANAMQINQVQEVMIHNERKGA